MTKPENETIKKQEKEDNESNNFLTKKKFTEMILESVKSDGHGYIDAIVHICEKNNIEIEDVKKYISPAIKDQVEAEGMSSVEADLLFQNNDYCQTQHATSFITDIRWRKAKNGNVCFHEHMICRCTTKYKSFLQTPFGQRINAWCRRMLTLEIWPEEPP